MEEKIGAYWRTLRKRDHLEDLSVDGRILKRIFNKQTSYGLEGPDIESQWGGGRDFPYPFRQALGPPSLLFNG